MLEKRYIRSVQAAIHDGGLKEHKASLVLQYTDNRTTHVSEMTKKEAQALLAKLNEGKTKPEDKRKKMIRLCYSLGYQCGLLDDNGELDKKRLFGLIKRLSPYEKGLFEHDFEEMKILCSVFKKYHLDYSKKKEKTPIA